MLLLLFLCFTSINKSLTVTYRTRISEPIWRRQALSHQSAMLSLLYPQTSNEESIKQRQHKVDSHPIYNFIHTYYRFPVSKVLAFSPGIEVLLERATSSDLVSSNSGKNTGVLSSSGVRFDSAGAFYDSQTLSVQKFDTLKRYLSILVESSLRQPMFACYGLHEWAMLYSGRRDNRDSQLPKHQNLPLRVSQDVVDALVEGKKDSGCSLRCTHYDAFRFFHPAAMGLNSLDALTRQTQVLHEQPGCIHATMDLFKYAFTLYPFISADLLQKTLKLALVARNIDMRSSPYDLSGYMDDTDAGPIRVETPEGRRQFVDEQEKLFISSTPLRAQLIYQYEACLSYCQQRTDTLTLQSSP